MDRAGGHGDVVSGTHDDPYLTLAAGDCEGLATAVGLWKRGGPTGVADRDFLLYEGASRACLGTWKQAKDDLNKVANAGGEAGLSCSERVVLRWLQALVRYRDAHPTFVPNLRRNPAKSPCPAVPASPSPTATQTAKA